MMVTVARIEAPCNRSVQNAAILSKRVECIRRVTYETAGDWFLHVGHVDEA